MKLGERDRRILALLGSRVRSVSSLADGLDVPPAGLEARLADLAENGLVEDRGDGRYARTESGRRVLVASAGGAVDERIDTSPEVERAIDGLDLRADEADAVRHAFSFVRYWGRATEAEIVDAIFSEAPAGRDAPGEWWDGLVRPSLAALPGVEAPTGDEEAWRYAGTPEAADPHADGRRVLSRTHPVFGDVKHALESLALTPEEREAARAAFAFLYRRGEATEDEVRRTVHPEYPAGYDDQGQWWDEVIAGTFEALPGVERAGDRTWHYRRP